MSNIKIVNRYIYKNVEYKTLIEIQNKLRDVIGIHVLDEINKKCPPMNPRDFQWMNIKMLDILCSPNVRNVLMECYNVDVRFYAEFTDEEKVINILDYKE